LYCTVSGIITPVGGRPVHEQTTSKSLFQSSLLFYIHMLYTE